MAADDLLIDARLWRNEGGGLFQQPSNAGITEWPLSLPAVALGDLDGNAFPDLRITAFQGTMIYRNMSTGTAPLGEGCAGAPSLPPPTLLPCGELLVGSTNFALKILAPRANTTGFFWLSDSRLTWNGQPLPLDLSPFGALGCQLLCAPQEIRALAFDSTGSPH